MKENKNRIKIIIVIAIVFIAFLITQLTNKVKEYNKKDSAEGILTSLSIDNYLKNVLTPSTEINKNILDTNSDNDIMLYFYENKNLNRYKLDFLADISGETVSFVYAKYDEYVKAHKKIFDKNPSLVIEDTDIIANLVQVEGDFYKVKSGDVKRCDENIKDDCYILLSKYFNNDNNVKLSKLQKEDNKIIGSVNIEAKDESLEATFEFEYEKSEDNYIAKSLKIKSINAN